MPLRRLVSSSTEDPLRSMSPLAELSVKDSPPVVVTVVVSVAVVVSVVAVVLPVVVTSLTSAEATSPSSLALLSLSEEPTNRILLWLTFLNETYLDRLPETSRSPCMYICLFASRWIHTIPTFIQQKEIGGYHTLSILTKVLDPILLALMDAYSRYFIEKKIETYEIYKKTLKIEWK